MAEAPKTQAPCCDYVDHGFHTCPYPEHRNPDLYVTDSSGLDARVVAVLLRVMSQCRHGADIADCACDGCRADKDRVLATLTAAGYAVVAVPEGVEVAHGARLVKEQIVEVRPYERRWSFTIEDKP